MKRACLTAACVALISLGSAAPALGATGDPSFVFTPTSNYFDGPCGLAVDSSDRLYVNDFDRGVLGYGAYPSFGPGAAIAGAGIDDTHPTGVAVDPATDDVYVDERTYITGYDSSGNQLMEGVDPLRIGEGTLGEGYGLAIDGSGRLYVADASDNTVKVYDPALSKSAPQSTIAGPPGGFTSLRHAALAVDRANGVLYVVDDLQPAYAEEPAAQVDVFSIPTGSYLGVLKYEIVDALPPGIAVNQSTGRVYVTSGNTYLAAVYAYGRGSQVGSSQSPAVGLTVSATGRGTGAVRSSIGGLDCTSACTAQIRSGADVTLSATPDPGSSFAGWSGAGCSGAGKCTVPMDQASTVSADFEGAGQAAPTDPQSSRGAASSPATGPSAPASGGGATKPHRAGHRRRGHHRHPRHRKNR